MSVSRAPQWLARYAPIAEAIARLFHPYVEVVIHDLGRDRIVGIWNPYSRRAVGDPSLLADLPRDLGDPGILGPYGKVLPGGQRLTSISVVLADAEGARRGLMCVNFDRSPLDGMAELLTRFAMPAEPLPPELVSRDWRERIALVVDETCRARHWRRDRLSREDRLALVRALHDQGLFSTRKAVDHAAAALDVSRATVYALLKEVTS
jgi:D-arginine utilization repressor